MHLRAFVYNLLFTDFKNSRLDFYISFVEFYIKGYNVFVVKSKTKEFITILKGGLENARVKSSKGY